FLIAQSLEALHQIEPAPIPGAEDAPPSAQTDAHCTDAGNAQRLARAFAGDVRYCYPWRAFLEWTGRQWARDPGDRAMTRAKAMARDLYAEAGTAPDAQRRLELAAWARKSESEARLRAMVFLAQSEPGVPIEVEALDANIQ